ncbi:hypothetical protein [Aquimarina sp. MMG016]|uniref:hypothetical protein n=1 Tax=Aquimarina sp. MMG016 TaxID=2822690 RepID=UPI001B39D63F|nr:hypothetical protein [Aquimarina sp. MMG016]MBQ4818505.1 hypothetical protein [Aquimarina sp. MMG016]
MFSLEADHFWGVDSFGAIYYSENNIFHKKWNDQELQYGDFILGKLSSVSILNPLKIVLFYEDSNTIILIDKYFNEIDRINFNTLTDFKNVTKVSAANDNSVWIFDSNTQRFELFDTDLRKTLLITQPINDLANILRSNFNYCWALTEKELLQFNIYGSLIDRFPNEEYLDFQMTNNDLVIKKDNQLYYYNIQGKKSEKINLPEIHIKQFYVTNEILYIYDQSKIYSFDLTSPKK